MNNIGKEKFSEDGKLKGGKSLSVISNIYDLAETCIFAAVVAVLLLFFVAKTGTVVGESMLDTMFPDDRYILTDLFYTPKQGDVIVFAPGFENDPEDKLWVKRIIATGGQTVEIKDGGVYVDGEKLREDYLPRVAYIELKNGLSAGVYVSEDDELTVNYQRTLYRIKSGDSVTLSGDVYRIEYSGGKVTVNGEEKELSVIETIHNSVNENPVTVPDGYIYVLGDNRTVSRDSRYIGPVDSRSIVGHVLFRFWPLDEIGMVD